MTTGFIGLGRMGAGMALNLLNKVPHLRVFDPVPEALARLTLAGATASPSPAAMAEECDLIFLCVPFAPEVRDVLFGERGIASAEREMVVIDTSTLDRDDALAIAGEAAERGITYWDCPVSGMPFRAENGTLTTMFGGTPEAFGTYQPLLVAFGEDTIHAGPLGSGQAMKSINNIIYNVNIAALAEVLPMAVKAGLDVDALAHLVTSASSRSFASEYFVPRMLDRAFDKDFTLSAAYKDIVNVQRMGIETRASLPVVNAMISSYQAAIAAGYGDQPKSAMLKIYEDALGVEFTRKPD